MYVCMYVCIYSNLRQGTPLTKQLKQIEIEYA